MTQYYLAVDIGASSGRYILEWMEDGQMKIQEIYQFENGVSLVDGTFCWDSEQLFRKIKNGMKVCAGMGIQPVSVRIDTWAVDYVLLDRDGKALGKTAGYRDKQTESMDALVYQKIGPEELYGRAGIQRQIFNTIYQLMAMKCSEPEHLEAVEHLLVVPDYLNYLLTGVAKQEYTNTTTTQLVNPETCGWDMALTEKLGYPTKLFRELSVPGTVVGPLMPEMRQETGLNCLVVLPATRDTGPAVATVPTGEEHFLYISSGARSLMGTKRGSTDCREVSRQANFTNEDGYGCHYRYLKNIMGLWMIQSVRREWEGAGETYFYGEICERASRERIPSIMDCNGGRFLVPESMCETVRGFCRETGQPAPKTKWEVAAMIYNNLAECHRICSQGTEELTDISYDRIHIVGGGVNADYSNRLTANVTGRMVYAGPTEATATGSLAAQMMKGGGYRSLEDARESIAKSFEIKVYGPEGRGDV